MSEKRTYTYEEVLKSAQRAGNNAPEEALFGHTFTKMTKFELRQVDLYDLHFDKREFPYEVLHYEAAPEYDKNKNLVGGDEYWAQKFAVDYPSGETAEPIIVDKTFGIIDGRHRSRAAFIRGEHQILAYFEISE